MAEQLRELPTLPEDLMVGLQTHVRQFTSIWNTTWHSQTYTPSNNMTVDTKDSVSLDIGSVSVNPPHTQAGAQEADKENC